MSKILVKEGQKVVRSEEIAKAGSTGKSTGPHVHYEVHVYDNAKKKWQDVNPINYYFMDLDAEQYEEMIIGITVRELPDGRSRCSTRTNGNISANAICAVHGGGGHYHAAVCELDEPPEKARIIMEETCMKFLSESGETE